MQSLGGTGLCTNYGNNGDGIECIRFDYVIDSDMPQLSDS